MTDSLAASPAAGSPPLLPDGAQYIVPQSPTRPKSPNQPPARSNGPSKIPSHQAFPDRLALPPHLFYSKKGLNSKVVLVEMEGKQIPRNPREKSNDSRPVPSARRQPSQTSNLPASQAASMPRSLRQADGSHAITSTK